MKSYYSIGLMSGTSLDGLDIALCKFEESNGAWSFDIIEATTIEYSEDWINRLKQAHTISAYNFMKLNNDFGSFMGECVNSFLKNTNITPNIIASHGHTVFHTPDINLTTQIGSGANICAKTGITTVFDFRVLDVALNGQGAPLVPIGDELLFGKYDACINLGGFANVSFKKHNIRVAYDICPVNIIINELVKTVDLSYDKDGLIAEKGTVNTSLLNELNDLNFYKQNYPKSLGREWVDSNFSIILEKYNILLPDKLRTIYEHIAIQICESINNVDIKNVLFTGGGAYNLFLIKLITEKTNKEVVIPSYKTINFKEALIFAFLGVLRMRKQTNCLSAVTGAKHDNIGGCVFEYC